MAGYTDEGLLHDMFRRQAKSTPNGVAVVYDNGTEMTYRHLDEATDLLAHYLQVHGVVPDSVVGIYMEKCIEYVVAYIATLKAGGAYIPLDISYPRPLLESILDDAEPAVVLTKGSFATNVQAAKHVLDMSGDWTTSAQKDLKVHPPFAPPKLTLDNLAYTVYSSGTTGKPKGIQCPHRGAVFSYHWRHSNYSYEVGDKEACNVFFVWEMLRPLLKGIPMYIIPDNVIYDPVLLSKFIASHRITRMLFTPSLFEAMLESGDREMDIKTNLKSLRHVIFCGEVVTTSLLERSIKQLPWIEFINLYSISEAHDVAATNLNLYYSNNKDSFKTRKFCPVGKVLDGVYVVILDDTKNVLPVGAPGEIFIGGPTLAFGYLKRPQLTEERFIKRPAGVPEKYGERLYKSGDWGYLLGDGSLEICGRCDSMVKIRGYSIEIQAIEAALLEMPMVNSGVVLVCGAEGEDKYLVAYIVPEGQTTKKEVRAALKRRLPFYMVPSCFVFLTSIPVVAATGKLDKKALPPLSASDEASRDAEGMATTKTEQELEVVWADVLQLKFVDIQENFFDLGGHSLLAAKLLSRVKEQFDLDMTVTEFFQCSTIYSMARLIDGKRSGVMERQRDSPTLNLIKEVEKHEQLQVSDMDMQLRAFWRSFNFGCNRWHKGTVLLTGATGFLGAFLLRDLLLLTETHVFCVVRELPEADGIQRLKDTLRQYGILPTEDSDNPQPNSLQSMFTQRVHTIKGDVSLVQLGLNEDDYKYLSMEVDFIIHAAAYVNLIYPYKALHGPNVLGTENVIIFASANKIKPLHYISTDGVFPSGLSECPEDANMEEYADQLCDGYSQTKWVAEQLAKKAGERGLPVAIYRLGNLSGDRKRAFWNAQDMNLLVLQGCALSGYAPDIDWHLEMTPVDFVSSAIVKLTQKIMLAMGRTFHIVNSKPVRARWVFDWMRAHGYSLDIVPFDQWKSSVKATKGVNTNLVRLLDTLLGSPDYFSELSTFINPQFQDVMSQLDLNYPVIDSELLRTYFKHLSRRFVIQKTSKHLKGRVAIVTGSSSGIGATIALALARAGCSVAMVARRIDKLTEVKSQIEKEGGVAIAVQGDVTDKQKMKDVVSQTEQTLGPVDILVNNAGVMYYTLMKNMHEEEWERQIDINCKGVVNGIGAVLEGMLSRGKGHIVNMSSDAGRKGFPGLAVYSGTKFFVEGLSQALRHEVSQTGVRVTCIQPGDVKTELQTLSTDVEAQDQFDGSGNNKVLEPEDVANAVLYAVTQPEYVGVNEILIEPRTAPV